MLPCEICPHQLAYDWTTLSSVILPLSTSCLYLRILRFMLSMLFARTFLTTLPVFVM